MSFSDDLKDYLAAVRNAAADEVPAVSVAVSSAWLDAEIIALLEQVERTAKSPEEIKRFETLLEVWRGWRAVPAAQRLATALQSSFLRAAARPAVEQAVRVGLARLMGLPGTLGSRTRDAELDRLAALAWDTTAGTASSWNDAARYAHEIRAARRRGRVELTPVGNVVLDLTGRDLVHWLLAVELATSTGPYDDWRLSKEAASKVLATPKQFESDYYWEDRSLGFSWKTMRRLAALGVVNYLNVDDGYGETSTGYELTPLGEELLRPLVDGSSPFAVMARTLTQDVALSSLRNETAGAAAISSALSGAQATALQARFFVHEINNALPPAQAAFEALGEELRDTPAAEAWTRSSRRVLGGIQRVFSVARKMQQLHEVATQAPERFEVWAAVRDAVDAVGAANGTRITAVPPVGTLPSILGFRERFVGALVNVLRNAQQAHAASVELHATTTPAGEAVLIDVDDDGPGVPEAQRRAIFEAGVSLRTGGTGQGLALVQEVVREMRGRVECLAGPLGGARFRLTMPVGEA